MYAVIKTGGKQYRVQPGDLLVVEKLEGDVGAEVAFDQVMMLGGADGGVTVGAPMVEGAVVRATLIETRKGDKVHTVKKIRRQGHRRTHGHRQNETVLRVTGLEGAGQTLRWEGEVDLTPRITLRARARGLAPMVTTHEVMAQPAPVAPVETPADVEAKRALLAQPVTGPTTGAETAETASVTDAEGGQA